MNLVHCVMHIPDRYRILDRLGKQSVRKFGNVYLVEDKEQRTQCVLKAARKSAESNVVYQRLVHESTFNFNDSGLPRTLDQLDSGTEYLLIRNYLPGIPLDDYWQTLTKKDRLPFLLALLSALHRLFEKLNAEQVVHCDIKPGNVLVHQSETGIGVSLIDFGLALKQNDPDQRNILFPLGYAAPELLLNALDLVDHRSDIYALGVTIWRLFSGKLPLTHPNPGIFTNLQLTHPIPDHGSLPRGMHPILLKMCHKHSFRVPPNRMAKAEVRNVLKTAMNNRYASLEEVRIDLKKIATKKRRWF